MRFNVEEVEKTGNFSASAPVGHVFDFDKVFLNIKSPKLLVREGRILNMEAFARVSVGD